MRGLLLSANSPNEFAKHVPGRMPTLPAGFETVSALLPPSLSDPFIHNGAVMKTRIVRLENHRVRQVIARFGRARLIERGDGRAELSDASPSEQTEAKEWISLFGHDTILHVTRE